MRTLTLILVLALWALGPLSADVLTYTVTPNSGQFVYDFTLSNTGDAGVALYDVFLSLQTDITNIDTTPIGTPVGWGDPTGGLMFFGLDSPSTSFIEWAADFSGTYDVGIGASLGGFSFRSSVQLDQPITFALNGSTTDFATAQDVSSVPEPGSFVLLVTMLVPIAFGIRSRSIQT